MSCQQQFTYVAELCHSSCWTDWEPNLRDCAGKFLAEMAATSTITAFGGDEISVALQKHHAFWELTCVCRAAAQMALKRAFTGATGVGLAAQLEILWRDVTFQDKMHWLAIYVCVTYARLQTDGRDVAHSLPADLAAEWGEVDQYLLHLRNKVFVHHQNTLLRMHVLVRDSIGGSTMVDPLCCARTKPRLGPAEFANASALCHILAMRALPMPVVSAAAPFPPPHLLFGQFVLGQLTAAGVPDDERHAANPFDGPLPFSEWADVQTRRELVYSTDVEMVAGMVAGKATKSSSESVAGAGAGGLPVPQPVESAAHCAVPDGFVALDVDDSLLRQCLQRRPPPGHVPFSMSFEIGEDGKPTPWDLALTLNDDPIRSRLHSGGDGTHYSLTEAKGALLTYADAAATTYDILDCESILEQLSLMHGADLRQRVRFLKFEDARTSYYDDVAQRIMSTSAAVLYYRALGGSGGMQTQRSESATLPRMTDFLNSPSGAPAAAELGQTTKTVGAAHDLLWRLRHLAAHGTKAIPVGGNGYHADGNVFAQPTGHTRVHPDGRRQYRLCVGWSAASTWQFGATVEPDARGGTGASGRAGGKTRVCATAGAADISRIVQAGGDPSAASPISCRAESLVSARRGSAVPCSADGPDLSSISSHTLSALPPVAPATAVAVVADSAARVATSCADAKACLAADCAPAAVVCTSATAASVVGTATQPAFAAAVPTARVSPAAAGAEQGSAESTASERVGSDAAPTTLLPRAFATAFAEATLPAVRLYGQVCAATEAQHAVVLRTMVDVLKLKSLSPAKTVVDTGALPGLNGLAALKAAAPGTRTTLKHMAKAAAAHTVALRAATPHVAGVVRDPVGSEVAPAPSAAVPAVAALCTHPEASVTAAAAVPAPVVPCSALAPMRASVGDATGEDLARELETLAIS